MFGSLPTLRMGRPKDWRDEGNWEEPELGQNLLPLKIYFLLCPRAELWERTVIFVAWSWGLVRQLEFLKGEVDGWRRLFREELSSRFPNRQGEGRWELGSGRKVSASKLNLRLLLSSVSRSMLCAPHSSQAQLQVVDVARSLSWSVVAL